MPDKDNFNCIIEKKPQLASGNAVTGCLMASGYDKLGAQEMFSGDYTVIDAKEPHYIVRRLTPLECERLQGFPDFWTDIGEWTDSKGKLHKESSDSARYAALGNSIALPSWFYVLSKLSEFCEEKTMASLFDGIGGFPLIWDTLNGKGSCLWASEIEEFPIAVTKHHFPDEEKEKQGD